MPPGYAAPLSRRVGGEEGDRVARDERHLGVARDLVAVQRRDDVLVEGEPGAGGRLAERRGRDDGGIGAAGRDAAQRAEAAHGDRRSRASARRLVVGRAR